MNPTVEKILAIIAMGCLIAFMMVVVIWVPRWNLISITVISLAMAAYDFYRDLFTDRGK